MTRLFHISDDTGITLFEPRRIGDGEPRIWAIDAAHLCNYLLPRDCPRVCFRGPSDDALLDGARAVVVIEAAWEERVRTAAVAVYEIPAAGFVLTDAVAGYWQSATSVTPLGVRVATDLPAEIAAQGAQLRVLESLWDLADRVQASGLGFSLIRMRNARAR